MIFLVLLYLFQYIFSELFSSGLSNYGQLGLGITNTQINIFTKIPITNIISVSCGEDHTLIINNNNTLLACGNNQFGQLGLNNTNSIDTFTIVTNNIIKISAGYGFSSILDINGNAYTFGFNFNYQLGTYDNINRLIPTFILSNVTSIVSAVYNTYFLMNNKTVIVSGDNTYGQLGIGNTLQYTIPVLSLLSNIIEISSKFLHCLALDNNNNLWGFGSNSYGQLTGTSSNISTPIIILNNTKKIFTGYGYSAIIDENNRIMVIGNNNLNQLGLTNLLNTNKFIYLMNGSYVALGYYSSFFINNNGYVIGENSNGNLGIGNNININLLTPISLSSILDFSFGMSFSFILTSYTNCFGIAAYDINTCSGNGNCYSNNNCTCYEGFSGLNCQYPTCFGINGSLNNVCSGNGNCSNINECSCFEGYSDLICSTYYCYNILYNDSSVCNNKGNCSKPNICNCIYGYTGDNCVINVCFNIPSTNSSSCSGYGICNGPDLCICDNSHFGSNCEYTNFYSISNGNWSDINIWYMNNLKATRLPMIGDIVYINNYINIDIPLLPSIILNNIIYSNNYINITYIKMNGSIIAPLIYINNIEYYSGNFSGITYIFNALFKESIILNNVILNGHIIIDTYILTLNCNIIDSIIEGNGTIINIDLIILSGINFLNTFFINNGSFYMTNSTLYCNLTIESGIFNIDGIIIGTLNISNALIKLNNINTLNITNLFMYSSATLMVNLYGLGQSNKIYSDNIILNCLIFVKFNNGYYPNIGNEFNFLFFNNSIINPIVTLIGASYRNAQILLFNNNANLIIIYSIIESSYSCTYLGNQLILEFNKFTKNILLTLTKPLTNNMTLFFGFDNINVIINDKIQIINNSVIDAEINIANTVFNIGPLYQSISLFMSLDSFENQKIIIYNDEIYQFSILNSPLIDCTNYLDPERIETYSIPVLSIVLFIYILFFIICLIFRNKQPLKSRGISPFLTIVFLIIQLTLEIRNYFYITPPQQSLCLYFIFSYYPLITICFITIFLYFIRYFSIINLNTIKNNEINYSIIIIRILKLLSNIWFISFLLLLIFLSSIIFYTIIFFIVGNGFICKFTTLIVLKTIMTIELIVIYSAIIFLLLIDIFLNIKNIIKCKYLNDPHYFRLQILLFLPYALFDFIIEIITLINTLTYVQIIEFSLYNQIFNTINFGILFIIDVLFPLILTIFKIKRKKEEKNNLDIIMQDKDLYNLFELYCKEEFSIENLNCYRDLLNFKKSKEGYYNIYSNYFNGPSSIYEVNISKKIYSKIYKNIAYIRRKKRQGEIPNIDPNIFDEAENEVKVNLCDTLSRFILTKKYKQFIALKNLQIELLEKN